MQTRDKTRALSPGIYWTFLNLSALLALSALPALAQDGYDAFLQQMQEQNNSDRPFALDRPQVKMALPDPAKEVDESAPKRSKGWAKLIDQSREFVCELPDGWSATSTPFIRHSIFILRTEKGNQTIFFQLNKGSFKAAQSAKEVQESFEKRFQNFKLLSATKTQLGNIAAVKLVASGETDEQKLKIIAYIRPLKRGTTVTVSGTFAQDEKEKETEVLDAIFVKVATSIAPFRDVKLVSPTSKIGPHIRVRPQETPQLPQTQSNGEQQN